MKVYITHLYIQFISYTCVQINFLPYHLFLDIIICEFVAASLMDLVPDKYGLLPDKVKLSLMLHLLIAYDAYVLY